MSGRSGHTVPELYALAGLDYATRVRRRGSDRNRRPATLRTDEYAVGAVFASVAVVPLVIGVVLVGRGDALGYWAMGVAGLLWAGAALLRFGGAEWLAARLVNVRPGRADPDSVTRPAHQPDGAADG